MCSLEQYDFGRQASHYDIGRDNQFYSANSWFNRGYERVHQH